MIHVVTGPPASGKTTWVAEHARPGIDLVIDFDAMAGSFNAGAGSREYDQTFARMVQASRRAAVDYVLKSKYWTGPTVDAFIIHTNPNAEQRKRYSDVHAEFHIIDPGEEIVLARIEQQRPAHLREVALDWYHPERVEQRRAIKQAAQPQYVYTSEGVRLPVRPRSTRRWC
ncbi:hypothetical protein CH276_02125 [Rhodococcus sp. 06-470-2]|uniref:AAA family ATPase n=1 Tax=unclassified Rhodococcus (in: high G+C Gram-positive bacteria) TaxID=192944 RepID=UPI000B9B7287|nr:MULTISPECIES: AAA family ATPase [unclassified Rhodococcus (in: high G+C Gram-positive bacteria)]OZC70213.1 hypothetical protein CH276_02125 [Rhodococcus sp. 06-470-2]OZE59754.1 hypothetical protein CH265_20505 [Rhodococcus sp. 05-2221-1B]